jgi:hypothetical protein
VTLIRSIDPRLESNVEEINRRLVAGGSTAHSREDFLDMKTGKAGCVIFIDDANDDILVAWPADDGERTPRSDPYWQAEIYAKTEDGFLAILRTYIHHMVATGRGGDVTAWTFEGLAQTRLMDGLKDRGLLMWELSTRAGGAMKQEIILADSAVTIGLL